MPSPSSHQNETQHRGPTGYEERDANAKGILWCVAGLLIFLILMDVVVHKMIKGFKKSPTPADAFSGSVRAAQAAAAQSPFPRLQLSPPADLQNFRSEESVILSTYGWVD